MPGRDPRGGYEQPQSPGGEGDRTGLFAQAGAAIFCGLGSRRGRAGRKRAGPQQRITLLGPPTPASCRARGLESAEDNSRNYARKYKQTNSVTQPITFAALKRALSEPRINGYRDPADADDLDAVARYLWNAALASALQTPLHLFEVTFRNAVFDASVQIVDPRGRTVREIPCWLDMDPTFLYANEEAAVRKAKDHLRSSPRSMTPGHLVAKLGFGFWVNLMNSAYEQGRKAGPRLWPAGILRVFPQAPKPFRTRADLRLRVNEVRGFRNRVAHHEPIWDRDLLPTYDRTVETLGWINPGMARAVQVLSTVHPIFHTGPAAYRSQAELLLGTPKSRPDGL